MLRGSNTKMCIKVSIRSLPQNHLTCLSVHVLLDETNSLIENDAPDEELNWALQGKICCSYMRKVSLLLMDQGVELFLQKVGKV